MKSIRSLVVVVACLAAVMLGCIVAATWVVVAPAQHAYPATTLHLHVEYDNANGAESGLALDAIEQNHIAGLKGSQMISQIASEAQNGVHVVDQFGREYSFSLNATGLNDGEKDVLDVLVGGTYIATYGITNVKSENNDLLVDGMGKPMGSVDWVGGESSIQRLVKYKTVWHTEGNTVGAYNGEPLYTIEEALNAFGTGTIVVEYDTSFAHSSVAVIAGYSESENASYNVLGTLLVPYGASADNADFLYLKPESGLYGSANPSQANDRASTTTATTKATTPNHTRGYSTLTVPSNITLAVQGKFIVNAVLTILNGPSSYIYGANYGELNVNKGAVISLEGGTFDCMGYAMGEGLITDEKSEAKSTIYEPMNLSGYKGHNPTLAISDIIFPVNQFTIAQISCKMEIKNTAYFNKACVALISGDNKFYFLKTAKILGNSNDYFIQVEQNTKFAKSINIETGEIKFELNGNSSINNLNILDENIFVLGRINISTAGRQIPIAGHFSIIVQSGTATIPSYVQMKLLPGAKITVESGATLKVAGALYSYGEQNVSFEEGYTQFKDGVRAYPDNYTKNSYKIVPTKFYTATTPADIVINGTLDLVEGSKFGGEVSSTNQDGAILKIKTNDLKGTLTEDDTPGSQAKTYTVTLNSKGVNQKEPLTPLEAGTWEYIDGRWVGEYYQIFYNANGGVLNGEESDLHSPGEITGDTITVKNPSRDYHEFTGWYYDQDCTEKVGETPKTAVQGELVNVYAGWKKIEYEITFDTNADDSQFTEYNITLPSVGTWTYGDSVSLPQPVWNGTILEFSGWWINNNYTGEISEITNENINHLTIEGTVISVYGWFRANSQANVRFDLNGQYVDEIQDLPTEIIAIKSENFNSLDVSGATDGVNKIDDHQHEFYFVGWQLINKDHPDNPIDLISVLNEKIGEEYLDESGALVLYAKWSHKTQLYAYAFINDNFGADNVSITLTINGDNGDKAETIKIASAGDSTNAKHYYWFRYGTRIDYILKSAFGSAKSRDMHVKIGEEIIKSSTSSGQISGYFNVPEYGVKLEVYADSQGFSTCIIEGTLITLADGTQKPVEELTAGDEVLVFNHETGKYEAGTLWIMLHADLPRDIYRIVNLQFSNGSTVRIVDSHGLFDRTLGGYVFITEENVAGFIGHKFSSVEMINGEFKDIEVTLVSANITEEEVKIYSPISTHHMNVVAEGILTTTPITGLSEGLYGAFSYDEDMKFNEAEKQADIEKYGLYTYEDFKDLIPFEIFEAAPWDRLKVAVGKGLITWEDILWNVQYLFKNGFVS